MPATTAGDTTSFPFKPNTFTALLTTTDSSLTGDLSMKMLNVTVSSSGVTGTFQDQNGDGCATPANVRFHFASPKASGSTGTGTPPTGFYTQFWWSNTMSVTLLPNGSGSISQHVYDVHIWTDW